MNLETGRVRHIFLDDGGVLNDNRLRGPQWQRLVGEFFAPRLGGRAEAWSEANRRILQPLFDRHNERLARVGQSGFGQAELYKQYDLDWLASMCAEVEVPPPDTDAARLALVRQAVGFIMPRVRADYPGAAVAVRSLAENYTLRMASRGASWELGLTLEGMGVADCFLRLYGPDLVNMPKEETEFYRLIFEDAGVDPAEALVADDDERFLRSAAAAGAQVVLVGRKPASDSLARIDALADLPALLRL